MFSFKYQSYIIFIPSINSTLYFQPSSFNFEGLVNFIIVPSGFVSLKYNLPLKPTISLIVSANSFIEMSTPVPMFMWVFFISWLDSESISE